MPRNSWAIALLCLCSPTPSQSARDAEPSPGELLARAAQAADEGDSGTAIALASQAISRDSSLAPAYRLRGRESFREGKIAESVRDFDRYVELRPDEESRQWERGIAYFYAEQYEKGAAQFALYQTYHNSDVENSVWRFLCMVPVHGVEKARSQMLPIRQDRRIPMMQIYELYRGTLEPAEVLGAAEQAAPSPERTAGQRFYAHLYIGLYHEATGNRAAAARYIRLAADKSLAKNMYINRYMWDVSRIHAARLAAKEGS